MEEAVKMDIIKLLGYLRQVGADPLGFGEKLRAKNPEYWNPKVWEKEYKKAIFNVDVKINIETYGTIQ